ncbi:MAG: dockerin type I domain-containing protein, partial [Eubacteriales bacterium]|nr:dockerin type I domain-containing protein [Eubacteriales bacterium]
PTVTATYSDGSTKTVVATFTGYDMTTAGTQTVTATFEGKTTTYAITVNPVSVADFIIAAGEVEGKVGDATINVPLNITKMYANKNIGGISVEVNYDTTKFTFDKSVDWTKGDMIKVADDIIINTVTPGLIRIMFSTFGNEITPAMVAANNLFGSVKLHIIDTTAAFESAITLTTDDDLYDEMANTLIAMKDMGASLKAGKVTIKKDSVPTYTAQVMVSHGLGFSGDKYKYVYIKKLILSEGNGLYDIKIGDYELYWSPQRKCYVGFTTLENYDQVTGKFTNIQITATTEPSVLDKYGDMDEDGRVNISDFKEFRNDIEFDRPMENKRRFHADTNLDGRINGTDLKKMKDFIELEIDIIDK